MTKPARRIAVTAAAVVALAAVLYGMRANSGKETAGECPETAQALPRVLPLERGDVAAATSPKRSAPVAALDFLGPDGKAVALADFRGKVVLFNLWATWCVPCREEMPALDRLQGSLGSKDFEVVAVNIDTTRLERVAAFLRDAKIASLASYTDPKADTFYRLKTAGKALGLPTSILVGRDGCEIATMAGPADWASGDALALVKAAL
jgi:thiol-disulfide isomerase/thioredoxin